MQNILRLVQKEFPRRWDIENKQKHLEQISLRCFVLDVKYCYLFDKMLEFKDFAKENKDEKYFYKLS